MLCFAFPPRLVVLSSCVDINMNASSDLRLYVRFFVCFSFLSFSFFSLIYKPSDVAMVIITILVAKIYFPESLERGTRGPPIPRSYQFRRSQERPTYTDDENEVGDDDDDDDERDADAFFDDSDTEQDDFLHPHQDSPEFGGGKPSSEAKNFLDFDPEQTSKAKVLQRLLFCSLMLNITFVTWGALQVGTPFYVFICVFVGPPFSKEIVGVMCCLGVVPSSYFRSNRPYDLSVFLFSWLVPIFSLHRNEC